MKKIFTLVLAALAISSASFVANAEMSKMIVKVEEGEDTGKIYINPFSITAGEAADVDLIIDTPDYDITAYQADILLPEGLSIPYDEEDEKYSISATARMRDHSLLSSFNNGVYRILCYSGNSKNIKERAGAVAVLHIVAAPDFKGGEISITKCEVAEKSGTAHIPGDVTVIVKETSGVELVSADNSEAVYYNLQGVRVENPASGVFVKVQNGKAVKVVK